MTEPVRLQLSRKRGFNLQEHSRAVNGLDAVNVARPGKWGNPFRVGYHGDANECVMMYRGCMTGPFNKTLADVWRVTGGGDYSILLGLSGPWMSELRGKNLACWCKPGEPCHADVLIELANRPTPSGSE